MRVQARGPKGEVRRAGELGGRITGTQAQADLPLLSSLSSVFLFLVWDSVSG